MSISLSPYTIRFPNLYKFADAFEGYLVDRQRDMLRDDESKRALTVKRHERDGETISGVVETGEYGVENTVLNIETGETTTLDANQAPMKRFYFHMSVPEITDGIAILILQRQSQYGIRTVFGDDFKKHIERDFAVDIDINPIMPRESIDRLLEENRVTKIRILQPPSGDIAGAIRDPLDKVAFVQESRYIETRLVARVGERIYLNPTFKKLLLGPDREGGLAELLGDDKIVKAEVSIGGKPKTIDLSNSKMNASFDITDAVTFDNDGHPNFSSIDTVAKEHSDALLGEIDID